ncbi:flagellar hook-basal body protein FliE [Aquimixticola soesokkakensis]|uniref:Flagellar hook-basal body complex protein FliE n=1 Tax=Aquimixticola soesokkakensis TaxID=1519096 RepID=A0A1Y5RA17_9RHOB|nr:flagellar hook-basal body complex protein FliE [Aquimixticola soesokkakensis]SLN12629.1 flagellar hook-basal body protein FliE [Aquimixticola soesokkakensis]
MDILSTYAAQGYTSTRPATAPDPAQEGAGIGESFGTILKDFAQTLRSSEETAEQAMTGGADAHSLVQALAQTELAVEAAVTVRDKVVEAYQEILRMPV